jgi:hypothetical protein
MFLSFNVKLVNFQNTMSFSPSINKSDAAFVLVHIDVCGPSRVVSLSGYLWFVFFIDDFSQTTWIYLLKDKSDVFCVLDVSQDGSDSV